MLSFSRRIVRYLFPFICERILLPSQKNPLLAFEQDGVWGRHISSGGAFQSGDYPEGMWKATFRTVPLTQIRPRSILVLGSGGGSAFYIVQKILQNANLVCAITGVERDPLMTHAGRILYGNVFDKKNQSVRKNDIFSLPPSDSNTAYHAGNITVFHTDAHDFLKNSQATYSLIMIDLFECFEVIPLVFDRSFIEDVYNHLDFEGHIIINAFNAAKRLIPLWKRDDKQITSITYKQNTVLWIHS